MTSRSKTLNHNHYTTCKKPQKPKPKTLIPQHYTTCKKPSKPKPKTQNPNPSALHNLQETPQNRGLSTVRHRPKISNPNPYTLGLAHVQGITGAITSVFGGNGGGAQLSERGGS